MKHFFTACLFILCLGSRAQELLSSPTSVESCNDQQDCLTIDRASYLFYDESRNEFYLKVDFSKFRTDEDTTGNWLNDAIDTMLYYKVILLKDDFPELSNQSAKTLKLNGRIFYNGIWKDQGVEMTLFTAENSLVPNPNTNLKYDAYKVTFSIPFVPKDYKTYKKLYYNNQTVTITVTLGRINLLRPGMEFHLKDVYYQSTR